MSISDNFPPAFLNFLHENGIDPSIYSAHLSLERFIRFPYSLCSLKDHIDVFEKETKCILKTSQLDDRIFSIPGNIKISQSTAYKTGILYGIDLSSAIAVKVLKIEPGDHCLDLCCAPGAKLAMIAELAGERGSVTGVDISTERLNTCKGICKKYSLNKVTSLRLFQSDGQTFDERPDVNLTDYRMVLGELSKRRKKRKFDGNVIPVLVPECKEGNFPNLYDKVIVDAECTHDGSIRHILKYEFWGWDQLEKKFLSKERLDNISALQKNLILNGFRLLRPGGAMIYSTCSFSRKQNEDIVSWLLEREVDSFLEFIELPPSMIQKVSDDQAQTCTKENLSGMLRLGPLTTGTSGLFIARIGKKFLPKNSVNSEMTENQ